MASLLSERSTAVHQLSDNQGVGREGGGRKSSNSCAYRIGGQRGKGESRRAVGHVEFLEEEEVETDEAFVEKNASDVIINIADLEISNPSLVQSRYTRKCRQTTEEEERRTSRQVVTGGTLTFVFLAAVLVTASFLMSPAIEELFGKVS